MKAFYLFLSNMLCDLEEFTSRTQEHTFKIYPAEMALYLNTNIFSVTENTSTEAVFVIKVNRL